MKAYSTRHKWHAFILRHLSAALLALHHLSCIVKALTAVQAWGMLDEKIQPVVQRMPILQKVLGFAQRWFLSLDPQRQTR